ncbi:MAG TPA: carbohydrate-binding family V/XII, partial [bacterium]|nr:carbohydrate-binding family V/XII [bacterium]
MGKQGLLVRSCAGLLTIVYLFVTAVAAYAAAPEWPRQIAAQGAQVIVYQPQPESLKGDLLTARAAVSVTQDGQAEAVFGTVWFNAHLTTDRDARTVTIVELEVPKVKFPNATPDQEQKLADILKNSLSQGEMTISLDRLMSSLDAAQKEEAAAAQLRNDPPQIIFAKVPSALVSVDGAPKLQPVKNSKMMRVMNTPFTIILDPEAKKYYLKGGDNWYSAAEMKGPWTTEGNTPKAVIDAAPAGAGAQDVTAEELTAEKPLNIIVSTQPAELIVSDGDPQYTPVDNTNLLFMSNTKSDVFMSIDSQQYYLLLSGRWYTSAALSGPWAFVPANGLPADFANIPEGSPKSGVLPFVAGTTQAKEAVLDASVPQTATVKRTAGKDLKVTYDGSPKFKDVDGVRASYAVNTASAVLKIDGKYYCCEKAVWYEAADPMGPWTVCVKVPKTVY